MLFRGPSVLHCATTSKPDRRGGLRVAAPKLFMTTASLSETDRQLLGRIDNALKRRELPLANDLIEGLLSKSPNATEAWIAAARLAQMRSSYSLMLDRLDRAAQLAPDSPLIGMMSVEALIHMGRVKEAADDLIGMEKKAWHDAGWLGRLAEAWSHCGNFEASARCARRAVELAPQNTAYRFALSSAMIALGELTGAAAQLKEVIRLDPADYDARYNLATLRKPTPENSQINEINEILRSRRVMGLGRVQLNYALAHEHEALGQFEQSFNALKAGADERRAGMAYRVERDVDRMAAIRATFDESYVQDERVGAVGDGPIFILGLPRSGSTLVDRIISAHHEVESLGELNDFPVALTALCREQYPDMDLMSAAARLDPSVLGQLYLDRIAERAVGRGYKIDKSPLNFLYIGLIAKALPKARIIHMRRDPMDNAFAMYKTLFRMGYPFSYDFSDIAAYVSAKDSLMAHWREILPGRVLDVDYENVVAEQEAETRRILDYLGLPWDPACLDFHQNASPSATASAAQVRQPLYSSSVGKWKQYSAQLQPLKDLIEAAV